MMNDEMTYQQAARALDQVDERVKTLMLAHLLALGVVDMALGNELLEFYSGVGDEFWESEMGIKN